MTLLLTSLWPALAASLLLGLGVGAQCGPPRTMAAKVGAGALVAASLALAVVAFAEWAPGRPGFWIEAAAGSLAAYLAGCVIGALGEAALRRARLSAPPGAGRHR